MFLSAFIAVITLLLCMAVIKDSSINSIAGTLIITCLIVLGVFALFFIFVFLVMVYKGWKDNKAILIKDFALFYFSAFAIYLMFYIICGMSEKLIIYRSSFSEIFFKTFVFASTFITVKYLFRYNE